jgi:hypothetical protein
MVMNLHKRSQNELVIKYMVTQLLINIKVFLTNNNRARVGEGEGN